MIISRSHLHPLYMTRYKVESEWNVRIIFGIICIIIFLPAMKKVMLIKTTKTCNNGLLKSIIELEHTFKL